MTVTNDSNFDERKSLQHLSEGSEFAFIQLFDHYRPAVFRSASRFLDSKEQAEEIVQEVFMEVWQRRATITKVLNFKAYLFTMVRNQVYDTYRAQSEMRDLARELLHSERSANDTEKNLRDQEYQMLFREAVEQLPEIQRQIFHLARNEELSHKEIAERLDLSHLAVKAHMRRALVTLRTRLEPYFGASSVIPAVLAALLATL